MSEMKGFRGADEPTRGDLRPRENKPVLSASQQEAISAIVEAVEKAEDEKLLFLLEGVSGIGKSMVGDEVEKLLGDAKKPRVIALESPDIYRNLKEIKAHSPHHILAIGTPREVELAEKYKFQDKEFSDYKMIPVLVKGMNREEIITYIKSLGAGTLPPTTVEEIATYSLGVPLLAQRMAAEDMSFRARQLIAAGFLRRNVKTVKDGNEYKPAPIEQYFSVEIPNSVRELANRVGLFSTEVYSDLHLVLSRLEDLRSRGFDEESPFFVAPQSEGIYDRMLQRRVGFNTFLSIYAPQISQKVFERIQQAFRGIHTAYGMDADMARVKAFFGTSRKTAVHAHTKDSDYWSKEGVQAEGYGEYGGYNRIVRGMESDFQKGKYPIKPQAGSPETSFHVSAWGHEGDVYNQVKLGWALESLLQHRGVPYIVENQPADMWYVYNPKSRSIESFTPPSDEKK